MMVRAGFLMPTTTAMTGAVSAAGRVRLDISAALRPQRLRGQVRSHFIEPFRKLQAFMSWLHGSLPELGLQLCGGELQSAGM